MANPPVDALQGAITHDNQTEGYYIISGGGKRLRPLIVLLAARACGYRGSSHIDAAAFIEYIHTATLLHDDVVDGSEKRRGRDTANAVYGNQASVLVGDFVYSRAFQMMAAIGSQRVMEIMSEATNVIAEGEVLQLMTTNNTTTTEDAYLDVIRRRGTILNYGCYVGHSAVRLYVMGDAGYEREATPAEIDEMRFWFCLKQGPRRPMMSVYMR